MAALFATKVSYRHLSLKEAAVANWNGYTKAWKTLMLCPPQSTMSYLYGNTLYYLTLWKAEGTKGLSYMK